MPKIHTCKACHRKAERFGYCLVHQNLRKMPAPRTDTATWRSRRGRKMRERYLADHPYCFDCMTVFGRPVPATQVHHLHTQRARPDLVLDGSNMLALCDLCHDRRHGRSGGGVEKQRASGETF